VFLPSNVAHPVIATINGAEQGRVRFSTTEGPNTGSGRTLTVPEPKTKDFMSVLVQLTKGTA